MSVGVRLPLRAAQAVAESVVAALRPACERIEIAGSIRRRRPDVGDVEIVAVSKVVTTEPMEFFGEATRVALLPDHVTALLRSGTLAPHPERPANGERYKRLWIPATGLQLDLFIVSPPAQWGPILAIRTGPAEFSKRLVEALHPKGLRCEGGRVLDWGGVTRPCPEERDFFAACGVPWTEPEARG